MRQIVGWNLILFVSLIFSWVVKAADSKPAKITSETVQSRYSLEQMHQALLLFRAISDRVIGMPAELPKVKGKPVVLECAPSPEQVREWMPEMHAQWDRKIETSSERLLSSRNFQNAVRKELKQCQKTCQCAAYATLLEKVEDKLPAKMKPVLQEFQKKASQQTPEQTWVCAQKAKWFCNESSVLKRYLSQENNEPEFLSDVSTQERTQKNVQ